MAYSVTPLAGLDLTQAVATNPNSAGTSVPAVGPLGLEVFGSDGKLYVLAQANASIPASTTVCTIDPATFLVTATGGAYTSVASALTSGQVAFFSKASV